MAAHLALPVGAADQRRGVRGHHRRPVAGLPALVRRRPAARGAQPRCRRLPAAPSGAGRRRADSGQRRVGRGCGTVRARVRVDVHPAALGRGTSGRCTRCRRRARVRHHPPRRQRTLVRQLHLLPRVHGGPGRDRHVRRGPRELVATLHDRAERAEREQALRVAQARTNERARIAREMHEVLAHRISLVAMHAGALPTGPTSARRRPGARQASSSRARTRPWATCARYWGCCVTPTRTTRSPVSTAPSARNRPSATCRPWSTRRAPEAPG